MKIESVDLKDFCLDLAKKIEDEDVDIYLKLLRKWAKNRNFYRGNQRGFWDNQKKMWVTVDVDNLTPSEASILVINNQFRPQVKTLVKEFSRSVSSIKANPLSDSQIAQMSARFSDALIKFYQHELLTESFRQREAKFLLLCGNAFRYTYYDKEKKSAKVKIAKHGKGTLPAYESHSCIDCATEYPAPQERCECGGAIQSTVVEAKEINNAYLGDEVVNTGDPVTECVDPTEIKVWVGADDIESSPYLRRKRIVREEFIVNEHPNHVPKDTELTTTGQYQQNFMSLTGGKEGQFKQQNSDKSKVFEYDQYWLDPQMYRNRKLETDIVTESGEVVPAGTLITDAFPDGLYFCKQGNDILCYEHETKNDRWLHIPYDISIDGFWADGLEDAVQNQQIINEYNSLGVENVLYNASPKLIINPRLINPTTVTGRPRDMIPLSDNARLDSKPDQAFAQISGMSLTSEVMLGMESSKRDMREQTGALVGFNGQGDSNIDTATGMSIARDSALALVSTSLALTAECNKKWSMQVLRFVQKHWYEEKYKFLLGKYNEAEARAFKNCEIEKELDLSIEPYSWLPRTTFEKQQSLNAYLTAFGLPLGFLNPNIPESVRQYASQLYQVPHDINEVSADIRIAQKRLDKAREIAKVLLMALESGSEQLAGIDEDVVINNIMVTIADVMGVEEDLDDHQIFIDCYKRWLKTDEGQEAHPLLRQGVKRTMNNHYQFMALQRAEEMMRPALVDPNTQGQQGQVKPEAPPEQPFDKAGQRKTMADK